MPMIVEMVYKKRAECLRSLIEFTSLDGICMVEVGSYAGAGASVFASMPQVRTVWCVDPWTAGYDKFDIASSSDFSEVEAEFDRVMADQAVHRCTWRSVSGHSIHRCNAYV